MEPNYGDCFQRRRNQFTCLVCSQNFTHSNYKYLHMRKVHNIFGSEKTSVKCLEAGCTFSCGYKEKLQSHLSEVHGIEMDVAVKKFSSLHDFSRWKEDFELQEKCRFVKKSGSRPRDGGIIMSYYYCNRSGAYVSQGKGLKQGKKKGSAKSNNHCTASITAIELPNGKVDVKVCSTHYGHDSELQHLRLSRSEKFRIAEQLCRGVPRDLVLDDVRASAGPKVERIHLITMKDIKNIEKAYGIRSTSNGKEEDMFNNLHVWISNMMLLEHSPVLFFQEEGISKTKSHDVTLILLTKGQMEILQKYGNKGTFFISTEILLNAQPTTIGRYKPENIYITTVLVVDELNESFPVSFMVSNQGYHKKYQLLFESLKKRVPTISAEMLLTDGRNDIFDWWCLAFEEVPKHLWCNRFIDSDWRENLISIADEDLQVSIYERLFSYLESPDKNRLETTLQDYIATLQENPLTTKFTSHFIKRYIGSEQFWAGCYGKQDVPISAQLNMEVFCNNLIEGCERKHWDRNFLVKVIQNLLKLANDKQCMCQTKLDKQTQERATHHELGLNIKPEYIIKESEESWRVESTKDPKNIFANVTKQTPKCDGPPNCALFCSKCNICVHQWQCSCRVYSYDHTMCKHIHAVALNYYPPSLNPEESESASASDTVKTPKDIFISASVKWQRVRCYRKNRKKEEDLANDKSILPVVPQTLNNKQISTTQTKRKRGRPPKHVNLQNKDEINVENKSKTRRKRGRPPKRHINNGDESMKEGQTNKRTRRSKNAQKDLATDTVIQPTGNESILPRRINILRKYIKKST